MWLGLKEGAWLLRLDDPQAPSGSTPMYARLIILLVFVAALAAGAGIIINF
jgi:hypothetical protein